jgi:hypothetical protein
VSRYQRLRWGCGEVQTATKPPPTGRIAAAFVAALITALGRDGGSLTG